MKPNEWILDLCRIKQTLPKQKEVDTFIHRNSPRGVAFFWARWGFEDALRFVMPLVGSFQPLNDGLSTRLNLPSSSSTSSFAPLLTRLYKAFDDLINQQKRQKIQSIWRPCMVFAKFWNANQFRRGLLKYLSSFFIWRRTGFVFFLFSSKKIATKLNRVFIVLRRMNFVYRI